MAGKTPRSEEFMNWINESLPRHRKRHGDDQDPLTKKKQSKVPTAVKLKNHSLKYDRENEGRINTRTEDDYNRWIGLVDMKNMAREAAYKTYKRKKGIK